MHAAHKLRRRLAAAIGTLLLVVAAAMPLTAAETAPPRPNILWITSEDNGPHLGCYGDAYATTPNLDRLAARGLRYRRAWSNAPVCAPARTAIISGLYPPATGAEHMRSETHLPEGMWMFPRYLREAGYYCTNHVKEDYNLAKTGRVWDESSNRAHWKNRAAGQPFFAVFNHTVSHESQIRIRPHRAVHDPAKVRVPKYHPDTPEVRQDWAQYYDKLAEMDALVGKNLRELEEAGLAEETIVVYFGDHGSGMPRNKRWLYNSGLHVPLLVYIPDKFARLRPPEYAAGGESARLVSFVDLAPTMLKLAGIEPPSWMQGQPFLGPDLPPPPKFLFGFRGRMDERIDLLRSATDGRYVYIRNYMPHLIYGQYMTYMWQTPTTRVWERLYQAGQLDEAQSRFWQTKPTEELYDLENDPDEIDNLADSAAHQEVLQRLRGALRDHTRRIGDLGFLPEDEMHRRAGKDAPYVLGRDEQRYPLARVLEAAEIASARRSEDVPRLVKFLSDEDSAVRYWGAVGLLAAGEQAVQTGAPLLRKALADPAPSVRIPAAQALALWSGEADRSAALAVLVDCANVNQHGQFAAVQALNALDALDDKAADMVPQLQQLPWSHPQIPARMRDYIPRLLEKTLADLRP